MNAKANLFILGALLPLLALACSKPSPPPRPNVLLLVVDSLRRDAVGVYSGVEYTPNIDRAVRGMTVFRRAYAQSPYTTGAAGSIWTGTHQSRHGYYGFKDRIDPRLQTIGGIAQQGGYSTYLASANPHVSDWNGFTSGFDHCDSPGGWIPTAAVVNDYFTSWLDSGPAGPFFAVLWYIDTHTPYRAPGEWETKQVPNDLLHLVGRETAMSIPGHDYLSLTPDQRKTSRALYNSEVAYFDHCFGDLVGEMKDRGLYDDTIIILTSDHGEAFWDRGWDCGEITGHPYGGPMIRALTDIPLLIKPVAPVFHASISTPVQHIDLSATIADILNVGYTGEGVSLLPFISPPLSMELPPARPVFMESAHKERDGYRRVAVVEDGFFLEKLYPGHGKEPIYSSYQYPRLRGLIERHEQRRFQ